MMLVNGIKYNMSSVRRAQISLLSSTDEAEIAEDIRWMNDHYQQIAQDLSRYERSIWTDHERSIFMPVKTYGTSTYASSVHLTTTSYKKR